MKWIKEIRSQLEKHFTITGIETDVKAAAFFIRQDSDLLTSFETVRKELKQMGFIAALREDDSRPSVRKVVKQLANTPHLREIATRIEDARENDVRRVWVDRFFEMASCPQCQAHLTIHHGEVSCPNCFWDPTPHDEPRYVIVVSRFPRIDPRSIHFNIALLITTIITTTITGSSLWIGYQNETPGEGLLEQFIIASTTPEFVLMGALFFSLPLMIILGVHELGHYFMSKHHGVSASLPFFIPFPPIYSILGTMGAFISMREPMPNKKALFDIGIAGPIAGLIMAIPITLMGLMLTEPAEHVYLAGEGPHFSLGIPLLFQIMDRIVPSSGSLHPMAFAGWVGLFLTALNLLPAGQLDGGHVARALLGEKSMVLSYSTLAAMILVGLFVYPGWLLLGAFIMFIGAYHPPPLNELMEVDMKRKALGVFSIVMLVLCVTPQPLIPIEYDITVLAPETEADINPGGTVDFDLFIQNSGQITNTYDISNVSNPDHWIIHFDRNNVTLDPEDDDPITSRATIDVSISAPLNATPRNDVAIEILVRSQNSTTTSFTSSTPQETISYVLHVKESFDMFVEVPPVQLTVTQEMSNSTNITVRNAGIYGLDVRFHSILESEYASQWDHSLSPSTASLGPGNATELLLSVNGSEMPNGTHARFTIIALSTTPGGELMEFGIVHVLYLEVRDESDAS